MARGATTIRILVLLPMLPMLVAMESWAQPGSNQTTSASPSQSDPPKTAMGAYLAQQRQQPILPPAAPQSPDQTPTLPPINVEEVRAKVRAALSGQIKENVAPLTGKDVQGIRERTEDGFAGAARSLRAAPKPVTRLVQADFSSKAAPILVRIEPGYQSVVVFTDRAGQPWPVELHTIGDRSAFEVEPKEAKQGGSAGNTVTVTAKPAGAYRASNLVVRLASTHAPLMFHVMPALVGGESDFRVDVQVPGLAPGASGGLPPVSSDMRTELDSTLQDLLTGKVRTGLQPAKVPQAPTGFAVEAYLDTEHLYLIARADLASPAWLARGVGLDGRTAWKLPRVPVIMLQGEGRLVMLEVQQ